MTSLSSKFSLKGFTRSAAGRKSAIHVKEVMTVQGSGIQGLCFTERSLLFARLSQAAYLDKEDEMRENLKECGFDFFQLITETDGSGSECWILASPTDFVIACRGTQPTQLEDVAADLKIMPVKADFFPGDIHAGFKDYVDRLWPKIVKLLVKDHKFGPFGPKKVWCTGHSLGAAMATIMIARARSDPKVPDPMELYTYGSPRVGLSTFFDAFTEMGIKHYRWVNANDIITRVPTYPYLHNGEQQYLNRKGTYKPGTFYRKTKNMILGTMEGMMKLSIDPIADHDIGLYISHIERLAETENPKFTQNTRNYDLGDLIEELEEDCCECVDFVTCQEHPDFDTGCCLWGDDGTCVWKPGSCFGWF